MIAAASRRTGSVCTGAFILGAAGLLDGRRATTHWASCARLQALFPKALVEPDAIHVFDGPICTSAGVTAGIDLALALVEADLGRSVAGAIAKDLVLFLRRAGGQSQYSETLAAQAKIGAGLSDLIIWASDNPDSDLSVPALAARACMSERTFLRRFASEVGGTPAKFVTELRLDRAKTLLEQTSWSLERVAEKSGFGSSDTLHRAFRRGLNTTPADFRRRFGGHPTAAVRARELGVH